MHDVDLNAAVELRVFVYGTLKQGEGNHRLFIRAMAGEGVLTVDEACMPGALDEGMYSVPVCAVRRRDVLTVGCADAHKDLVTLMQANGGLVPEVYNPHPGLAAADTVHGHLITVRAPFATAFRVLRALDSLEGFYGDAPHYSAYTRVLMPVKVGDAVVSAWAYAGGVGKDLPDRRIPGGRWSSDMRPLRSRFDGGRTRAF
jgi:gamma-glutamylcyclotransferase (GGCT)/AIG2-like uncharacterized protein YtfP